MTTENTTLDFGFYFANFFPMSDVFSTNNEKMSLVLLESQDADTRFLCKNSLLNWKYDFLESVDFAETQSLIAALKPEIILLDCICYQETLIKLKILRENQISRRIPVIVFSEADELIKESEILHAGADDFLLKPINFRKLEASIKRQIGKKLTLGGLL